MFYLKGRNETQKMLKSVCLQITYPTVGSTAIPLGCPKCSLIRVQIYHIYAVDSGLHNIKFIIYPIHSQILWVFDRNTENFSDTWTRDVNWKNLKEKPKLLNLLSITSWESFPGTYLWCRNQSFELKKNLLETFYFTSWVNRRWWGILLKACEAYTKSWVFF